MKPVLLHVDDDDLVAHLVQRELSAFEVRRVQDGEQALRFLYREGAFAKAPRPRLVLLDLHMPKRDGFSALKEMRADPALKGIPVAVFTTSQDPGDRMRAFALGANYFIQKPRRLDDFADLAETLARIVQDDRAEGAGTADPG